MYEDFKSTSPPAGWNLLAHRLTRDDTVAGYRARNQTVRGRCYSQNCRRTCWVDFDEYAQRGLTTLPVPAIKKMMTCNLLSGCRIDWFEEPEQVGLRLDSLVRQGPRVTIRFRCWACGYEKVAPPASVIARLKADGKGGEDTLHTQLDRLVQGSCKKCKATKWDVSVDWRDRKPWNSQISKGGGR